MSAKTVLVIDYEPNSLKESSEALKRAGFRVEVARDGVAGLQAFAQLRPELVLVEAMLPKKHGFEVCQTIKNSPDGASTSVVITTAIYKGRKYRADAFKTYRCDDYLEKPFSEAQLLEVCQRLTRQEVPVPVAATATVGVLRETPQPRPAAPPPSPKPATSSPAARSTDLKDMTEDEIEGRLDALLKDPSEDSPASIGDLPAAVAAPTFLPAVEAAPRAPLPNVDVPETDPLSWEALGNASSAFDVPEGDWIAVPAPEPPPAPKPRAVTKPPRERAEPAPAAPPRPKAAAAPSRPAPAKPQPPSARSTPRWVLAVAGVAVAAAMGAALWLRSGNEPALTPLPASPRAETPEPVPRQEPVPAPVGSVSLDEVRAPETAAEPPSIEAPRLATPPEPKRAAPQAVDLPPAPAVAISIPRPAPTPAPDPAPARVIQPDPQVQIPEASAEPIEEGVAVAEPAPPSESPAPEPAPAAAAPIAAGDLVAFESVDTAPVEVSRPNPVYPAFARQLRQQGTVTMQILIDETGIVADARLIKGIPGSTLNDSALQAVRTWTYRPATKGGVPVKVWKTVSVAFRL